MLPWKIDVAVLLIFFSRPDTFEQVFEKVRKARPSVLLLWQDGPRSETDNVGIEACRKIVENIDWECTVYRQYQKENLGCDPSTFYAHKWAFSLVDKCIVLEDDMLMEDSYFEYCKELLDKYENDDRINHICGLNMLGISENCPNDYLFSYTGSGAWASWRRVAVGWDETYAFLHDEYAMKNLKKKYGAKQFDLWYNKACEREDIGKAFWESILGFDCLLNNRYAIIPKKNMGSNIGLTADSTHSNTKVHLLEKSQQTLFNNKTYEMKFPIKHPKYIVPDYEYMASLDRLFGNGHPILKVYRKIVYICKCIRYGEFGKLRAGVMRRVRRERG